uniref:Putative secreted protein n=1 Tax=Anopheles marajoara TaxID=58244 RepID=A0A2M4C6Z6_9DIPT
MRPFWPLLFVILSPRSLIHCLGSGVSHSGTVAWIRTFVGMWSMVVVGHRLSSTSIATSCTAISRWMKVWGVRIGSWLFVCCSAGSASPWCCSRALGVRERHRTFWPSSRTSSCWSCSSVRALWKVLALA